MFGTKAASLKKMDYARNDYGAPPRRTFDIGLVAGDPFALATISVSIVGAPCALAGWLAGCRLAACLSLYWYANGPSWRGS